MATGTIKTLNDAIIVEEVSVTFGGDSGTYYKEFVKPVSKSGYTAVGVAGYRWNQVGILCYRASINNSEIHLGLASRTGTGTLSGINAYAYVLWVRNDLI